jgi:arylsulfatase A-like enzyme
LGGAEWSGFLTLLACLACGPAASPPGDTPPSLLLVTLDTTRADRLGVYGYHRTATPHLDALARDGVLFEFAIASAASTPASHASILTGLHPFRHGVRVIAGAEDYRLDPSFQTLASVLQAAGWHTAAFLSSFTVSEYYGLDRGFDRFDNGLLNPVDGILKQLPGGAQFWRLEPNQRRSDATTDAFLDWLTGTRRPFFAWIHYWDPHDPELLPPPSVQLRFPPEGKDADEPLAAHYDAELHFVDQQLGRVRAALRERGHEAETIVAVLADHGQGLGDHGWKGHRILYQEQIRLPLLLHVPGGPKGRRVTPLVRSIDLYPTLLELLGVEAPAPVQGRSLMPLLQGRSEPGRLAYAEALNGWDTNARLLRERPQDALLYAVMDREWKLIHRPQDPAGSELYHLADDPHEQRNLFRPDHPQAARLRAALDELQPYPRRPPAPAVLYPEVLERLRALGYAEP